MRQISEPILLTLFEIDLAHKAVSNWLQLRCQVLNVSIVLLHREVRSEKSIRG